MIFYELISIYELWTLGASHYMSVSASYLTVPKLLMECSMSWLLCLVFYIRPFSITYAIIEGHVQFVNGALKKTKNDSRFAAIRKAGRFHFKTINMCLVFWIHLGPDPRFHHDIPSPELPFQVFIIDMIFWLTTAVRGHKYILIVLDQLPKWVETSSSASAYALSVTLFRQKFIFSLHSFPLCCSWKKASVSPPK